jgi:chromosome segregation ATPase
MAEADRDDLADRVLALEQQQRADRRALGSLDADVSDLQAQRRQDVRLLQSLRDTQIEHGERLQRLESGLQRLESRFGGLDSRFGSLESRFEGLESSTSSGFAAVGARLDVIVDLLAGGSRD